MPTKRKSPIRHRVNKYQRNGTTVDSHLRGAGTTEEREKRLRTLTNSVLRSFTGENEIGHMADDLPYIEKVVDKIREETGIDVTIDDYFEWLGGDFSSKVGSAKKMDEAVQEFLGYNNYTQMKQMFPTRLESYVAWKAGIEGVTGGGINFKEFDERVEMYEEHLSKESQKLTSRMTTAEEKMLKWRQKANNYFDYTPEERKVFKEKELKYKKQYDELNEEFQNLG